MLCLHRRVHQPSARVALGQLRPVVRAVAVAPEVAHPPAARSKQGWRASLLGLCRLVAILRAIVLPVHLVAAHATRRAERGRVALRAVGLTAAIEPREQPLAAPRARPAPTQIRARVSDGGTATRFEARLVPSVQLLVVALAVRLPVGRLVVRGRLQPLAASDTAEAAEGAPAPQHTINKVASAKTSRGVHLPAVFHLDALAVEHPAAPHAFRPKLGLVARAAEGPAVVQHVAVETLRAARTLEARAVIRLAAGAHELSARIERLLTSSATLRESLAVALLATRGSVVHHKLRVRSELRAAKLAREMVRVPRLAECRDVAAVDARVTVRAQHSCHPEQTALKGCCF